MTGILVEPLGIADPFTAEEEFLRRIPPIHFDFDKGRIYSSAFDNRSGTDRMSVNRMRLSSAEETLCGHPSYGVASLTADVIYKENQQILHTPTEDNVAHCDVVGTKPKSVRRRLRNAARLVVAPAKLQA